MLDSFDALVRAAHEEPEPQRFLLVFARTVLPEDSDETQIQRFEAGQGGGLVPVMYVDKDQDELIDFSSLVAEAQQTSEVWGEHMAGDWDKVIVGCLAGRHSQKPTSGEAEEPLKYMVKTIQAGGSLGHLAAFDRQGNPIRFE